MVRFAYRMGLDGYPDLQERVRHLVRSQMRRGATTQDATTAVTAQTAQDNPATISNIRLWRPDVLAQNYISLQRFRAYYEFNDVDVDRTCSHFRTPRGHKGRRVRGLLSATLRTSPRLADPAPS